MAESSIYRLALLTLQESTIHDNVQLK